MNFSVSKNELYNALAITSHAVSSISPQPILRGIRIDAKDNTLTINGSDSDISIQKIMKADDINKLTIVEEGSILIEAKYLLEIVKKIDDEIINVEIIDGSLTKFSGGSAEFRWNGMNIHDYPAIDFSTPSSTIQINAKNLKQIIDQTSFAAAAKEVRPVLTGVNFKEDGTNLTVTATDSYRLAKKTLAMESSDTFSITIPARSLNEVKSTMLVDNGPEEITIAQTDKKAQFITDDMILQTRLLDGDYPSTDRLIPTDFKYTMKIDRQAFIDSVDRNMFIKNDNMSVERLQCSGNEIILLNNNQEKGGFKENLYGEFDGDDFTISFSGLYMLDAARSLTGSTLTIKFTGEMRPFVLVNEEDSSLLQLVLPVRTYN